ncbi:unnamed protein product [Rotaria sordida]|uniref:Uncharacterized protein n=1 Tax=Rotaria sordida TaxID=392033 RepID=A0A813RXJ0_9BILA|nr:unnamed protein product [Rotaria sordida]CAF0758827.1 unnamed protein product [Rotaria sordida]CAF0787227.1 unnamed protein product [Rotaria sordida]CAF0807146.1 unnamed protein product [Rotaria sordida]CAF0816894.1 unnamed protein product [Rotaria sordida]
MFKTIIIIQYILIFLVKLNHGRSHKIEESSSSPAAIFIKPKANVMRQVNPLKLLFTVVHIPHSSRYSIEWNLPFLKTMLLESSYVTDEDKAYFITKFIKHLNDYANWSEEKHYELERFTEKYFNIYKSPDMFLPFIDCPALTYGLMDEMINELQPNVDEHKRAAMRAKAVERLCE